MGGRHARLGFAGLPSPYPFVLVLAQSETERLLEAHLEAQGVRVERRVELAAFAEDGGGVTATLRHADGREETARAAWLVGCDGAHSTVRRGLGLPFEGARYEEGFWLADVRVAWRERPDELHGFIRPGGLLFAVPMRDGRHRLIFAAPDGMALGDRDPTLAEVQRLVERLAPPGTVVSDPAWLSGFRIHRRIVPRLRQGRVLLAGDAAHIHSPAGGQGMNTGIQDADNLAWKLALVVSGEADPALLDSYHAERHPVARAVLRGTDRLTRLVLARHPLVRALRDLLLPTLLHVPAVQRAARRAVSETGIRYAESPILAGHARRGAIAPGDRLPAAVLMDGTATRSPLDLLRDGRHLALLLAGAGDTGVVEGLARLAGELDGGFASLLAARVVAPGRAGAGPGVLLDPGGALHRALGAGAPTLCLVRPDGYVGLVGPPDTVAVGEYFEVL
ncbi:MAG TPA: FAD-dependent monooxygenase, partial [Methylomirabilota bacterium]|nr:FAD-dependent monooxygenase [Methylomirabilota bacterium]